MLPFTTQTLTIPTNGIRLHVEAAGPEDGPLVLLLHGFPEPWACWDNQIGPLARSGLRVIVPDQRGYNLSDRPLGVENYQTDLLVQDILGLIDHFGRPTASIVGHDWGGLVAWRLAMDHPERVEKLAILNAPHPAAFARALLDPTTGQRKRSWYIYAFQVPRLPELLLGLAGYQALKGMLRATDRPNTFRKPELRRYQEAWSRPAAPGQASALTGMINWYRAAAREGMRSGRKGYMRRLQVRVKMPTLILWGERDPALAPVLAEWSLKWCNNGRLVNFPEATHWLQHDEPERVANRLLDFIRES